MLDDSDKQKIRDDYARMAEVMIAVFERNEVLAPKGVDSEQFFKTVVANTLNVLKENTALMAKQMASEAENLAKEMKK